MRRTSTIAFGLVVLALSLTAAGCGGGGKKSAAATESATTEVATTEATTTESAMKEEATTEAATTEAATTEAATTRAATSPSFSALSGKCRDLASSAQKLSAAFTGSPNGADLKKYAKLLQDFAKKVPSEIRADFQVLADYVSKVADVAGSLKAGKTPDPQTLAKLQKISTEVDQAKLTRASQHVQAWVQKNCTK
jgi:hypothetical protein